MPYQMPSGQWRAKRMIHGRIKTKVFSTKVEAKKWEAEQNQETWTSQQKQEIDTTCLIDLANTYLDMAEERFSEKTVDEKQRAFKYLFRTKIMEGGTYIAGITPKEAQAAMREVFKAYGGQVANRTRKNLRAAWEWGKRYLGLPKENPFHEVDRFPADQHPRYVPPEDDFWKAYRAALREQDRVMLLTMLHTGARRAEVFRLTWDDVNLERRQIRFGTRKTGHGGMEYAFVPMTFGLHAALTKHQKASVSRYVFTDPDTGLPFKERQNYMGLLCNRAKVKPFGFHAIRHLSATILANEGLDIPSIQAILRHKSPNTTARYIKSLGVSPDRLDSIFKNRGAPKSGD
jgi:integrase